MPRRPPRTGKPIQVYLTPTERATLERLARELGVSRAEVLRRGVEALARQRNRSFHHAFDTLVGAFSNPRAPTDLAERHDDYAADDIERPNPRSQRRSL